MRIVPPETRVDRAYRVFPSERRIRFNEVEYAVPRENFVACFDELVDLVRRRRLNIVFPFECRWVQADDIWLSPFYQRDAVAISVHRYAKQPYREFFDLTEPILWKYDGRPHWGKMHSLGSDRFAQMYPRWSDFCRLRESVDPTGKFLNAHLRRIFGASY